MDLAELIRSRRSVGAFAPTSVPAQLVRDLLETAVWVPNHKLTEPWRFVFLTGEGALRYAAIRRDMALEWNAAADAETRRQAGEGTYRKFATVPAYLAVIVREHENPEIREEDFAACCCLVQNFLLLAWERGLGTSWKTYKSDPRLRHLLSLGSNEKVVGWLHLGYPSDEAPSRRRSPVDTKLTLVES
jgi:nitroreductase